MKEWTRLCYAAPGKIQSVDDVRGCQVDPEIAKKPDSVFNCLGLRILGVGGKIQLGVIASVREIRMWI